MNILSRHEPFIILLDLDHTIQGDIQPQLYEQSLIEHINTHISTKKIHQNKSLLYGDYFKGLLRPNFKRFILRMRDRFPNVEFFVYTASEDKWANYIVKIIEGVIGTRFNKRVFSRSDCVKSDNNGKLMKSINKLKPELLRILKRKYKLKNNFDFKYTYLIDNNYVLYDEEKHMLIKCPDYTTKINIDPLRSVPINIVKDNLELISKYILGYNETSIHILFRKIHERSASKKNKKDTYWNTQLKSFKMHFELS